MRRKDPVFFHETEIFQNWLKKKGLEWPENAVEQDRLRNLAFREGLEEATRRRAQEIERLAKEAASILLCSEETVRRALEQTVTAPPTVRTLKSRHNEPETVAELKDWIASLPDSMKVRYVPNFQQSRDDFEDRRICLIVTDETLWMEAGNLPESPGADVSIK